MRHFEKHILRVEASHRGGGVEIDLSGFGYEDETMVAYQNYLGGGMLGKIVNACSVDGWIHDPKLVDIADDLSRYFHGLTNHDDDEWEDFTYEQNQNMPISNY